MRSWGTWASIAFGGKVRLTTFAKAPAVNKPDPIERRAA